MNCDRELKKFGQIGFLKSVVTLLFLDISTGFPLHLSPKSSRFVTHNYCFAIGKLFPVQVCIFKC
jgi:hypothetical protein